jgi:hypothetical protein
MPLASELVEGKLPEVVASVKYGAGVAGALLVLAIGVVVKRKRAVTAA